MLHARRPVHACSMYDVMMQRSRRCRRVASASDAAPAPLATSRLTLSGNACAYGAQGQTEKRNICKWSKKRRTVLPRRHHAASVAPEQPEPTTSSNHDNTLALFVGIGCGAGERGQLHNHCHGAWPQKQWSRARGARWSHRPPDRCRRRYVSSLWART